VRRGVQGIEAADATFDIDLQGAHRGLYRHADVSPGGERIQGPQLAAHGYRELVQAAFPGDGEQAVGTGADAQRLDERNPVRLASLAIGDPHVAELGALDDERYGGGTLGGRFRNLRGRMRLAEYPVTFAVGVCLEQD
jgi:hypothetical protein